MKRILYFTGYRMVAQEWLGRKLASSVYFEPDEQGLDLFNSYLRSFEHEPVRLMVDLIEEEFRQIKIPMLRGSDRKAMLERNYAKYFRNSIFRHSVSQSVEKKKRKEEKLLIIGLTNQYLLEPWLKIIEDTRTPLSGIISLPLLSEAFIGSLNSENKVVILVSQQVPSNLRQSVFIDGKLILSRLVPIASFYQGDYASDVVRDIDSTQRYLISQRLVERSEAISVHILSNKRHFDKLTIKCAEDSVYDFKIYEINTLLNTEKIVVSEEQDFSSALFCYLVSKKLSPNHYARPKELRYYGHHILGLFMKAASIAILFIGIGLASNSAIKSWLYINTVAEAGLFEQRYKTKFNQLSQTRIDSTTSTASMQHIVQTVEEIQKNYLTDPESMFALVSQDISIFSDLRVKRLDWFVTNISDTEVATDVVWGKPSSKRKKSTDKTDKVKAKPKKGFFEVALVDAEFLNFDGNYRYALSAVDDLEKAMLESGNYYSVEITKRPLDIESDNNLSGDASIRRNPRPETADLSFRLVRELKLND